MRLRLALLSAALTLGTFVVPLATATPALAEPAPSAVIQAQCPVGNYSMNVPPYDRYWHIGVLSGIRYWHTVNSSGNYVGSSVTGCSSSGALLWTTNLPVTATTGDRCNPATSSIQYEYVGEYRQPMVSGPFIYFLYYRYWHVRTLGIDFVWRYHHSELARC